MVGCVWVFGRQYFFHSQFCFLSTPGCVSGPPNVFSFLKPVVVSATHLVHQRPFPLASSEKSVVTDTL